MINSFLCSEEIFEREQAMAAEAVRLQAKLENSKRVKEVSSSEESKDEPKDELKPVRKVYKISYKIDAQEIAGFIGENPIYNSKGELVFPKRKNLIVVC